MNLRSMFGNVLSAIALASALSGCGGGGGGEADVVVVAGVPVLRLDIALSRPGPEAIQLWTGATIPTSTAM